MHKNVKYLIVAALIFSVGIITDRIFLKNNTSDVRNFSDFKNVRNKEINRQFINPLLECSEIENVSNFLVDSLKKEVSAYITQQKNKGEIAVASVYFRDLNNGPWFGIGEKEGFIPGSLLKVPLMMSVYKTAMESPVLLKKMIPYNGSGDYTQYYNPKEKIEPGKQYTVDELIEKMIVYSDNDAAETLAKMMDVKQLSESYTDLGIDPPSNDQYSMSVRTYASFFRILYNSTFLNEEFSEKSLQMLSGTVFDYGITKYLPRKIVVSHKFGERGLENGLVQMHDCGIVYYSNSPYVLCIMTKGKDMEKLSETIARISKIVYDKIDIK